jgi:endonuclease III
MSLSRYFRPKERISDERGNDSNGLSKSSNFDSNDITGIVLDLNNDMPSTKTELNLLSNESDLIIDSENILIVERNPSVLLDADDISDSPMAAGVINPAMDIDGNTLAVSDTAINNPVKENRFAKWAYRCDTNENATTMEPSNPSTTTTTTTTTKQYYAKRPHIKNNRFHNNNDVVDTEGVVSKKRQNPGSRANTTLLVSQCPKAFVPMKHLSASEQQSEIRKWHAITTLFTPPNEDVPYTIEDRRYHMVLATLLHTRCQEPSVRVAIIQLVNYFQLHDVPITVQSIVDHSSNDNDSNTKMNLSSDIVPLIKNLQYYNSKVKYILQSSQYIWDHFNGIVPHTEKELLQLPGIGPLFADLLSTINTKELHEQYMDQQMRPTTTSPK